MYLASPFPPKMMMIKKNQNARNRVQIQWRIVGVAKRHRHTWTTYLFACIGIVCWGEPELKKCDCSLLSPVVFISRMEGSHQGLKSSGKNCPVQQCDFEEFRDDRLTLFAYQEG